MNMKLLALGGIALSLMASSPPSYSCNVHVTGPSGQWKFVQVHDLANGEVVLRQMIKSGESKHIDATGEKIRIDWKLAGYKHYRTGPTATCKGGNTVTL